MENLMIIRSVIEFLVIIGILTASVVGMFILLQRAMGPSKKPVEIFQYRWTGQGSELEIQLSGEAGTVRGSGTVWHWYPSGERCSSDWESFFAGQYRRIKWEEDARQK